MGTEKGIKFSPIVIISLFIIIILGLSIFIAVSILFSEDKIVSVDNDKNESTQVEKTVKIASIEYVKGINAYHDYRLSLAVFLPSSEEQAIDWKYSLQKPEEEWQVETFNDHSWLNGKMAFGNAIDVNINTKWTTGAIWLRREFELVKMPQNLYLKIFYDDEISVWINGIPAFYSGDWIENYVDVKASNEAFKSLKLGKNTIAVYCRQGNGPQGVDLGLAYKIND